MGLKRAASLMAEFGSVTPRLTVDEDAVMRNVHDKLHQKRAFRVDMVAKRGPYKEGDHVYLDIGYAPTLGKPTVEQVQAFIAHHLPKREILVRASGYNGDVVKVALKVQDQCLSFKAVRDIPGEFVSIGTGFYKRSGDEHTVWELRKAEDGSVELLRKVEETVAAMTAESEPAKAFSAGEIVRTPDGIGQYVSNDRHGNPIVAMGGQYKVFSKANVYRYDPNKDKAVQKDFFERAYGDAAFAKELVEKGPTRKEQ